MQVHNLFEDAIAYQLERAADNFGFTYFTYPMIEARLGNWDPGHPIHALTDFLNSPKFIAFAKASW